MNTRIIRILTLLAIPVATAHALTTFVNDTFTDADRIGGDDGSTVWPSPATVAAPTASNTQWVASAFMVASANGMLFTLDGTGIETTIGYFPAVTVGATPVKFTLRFSTRNPGATPGNLRVLFMDSTPSEIRATDANNLHSSTFFVDDIGYSLYSNNVAGGGSTANLSLTTTKRINNSDPNNSTFSNWLALGNSNAAGPSGNFEGNTDYTLSVTMVEEAGTLSITTDLAGGNFSNLHYTAQDAASPVLTFNSIYFMWAKGSGQFDQINLTGFTVEEVEAAAKRPIDDLLGMSYPWGSDWYYYQPLQSFWSQGTHDWIYTRSGWMYLAVAGADAIYAYSADKADWIYIPSASPNYVYLYGAGGWHYWTPAGEFLKI